MPAPEEDSTILACEAVAERGGWWVELVVAFPGDVVRHLIGPYRTEARARLAARLIRRAAGRSAPPPAGA